MSELKRKRFETLEAYGMRCGREKVRRNQFKKSNQQNDKDNLIKKKDND